MKPRLVDWITADLRCVTGNQDRLADLVEDWSAETSMELAEGDGLLVTGLSETSRPRIVYRARNLHWVIMVPWRPEDKLSVQLAVSIYLRKTYHASRVVRAGLDEEIDRMVKAQKEELSA